MITYRAAATDDVEAIAQLHARSWRENYRGDFTDAFLDGDLVDERRRVWRERLERPSTTRLVRVAVDGARLRGFVCVHAAHDPRWGSLVDNLHVARESARTGIGRTLMRQAGAWLAECHPDHAVYLLVLERNARARSFYAALGGRCAEIARMETHGGAMVRSCRIVWDRPEQLAGP